MKGFNTHLHLPGCLIILAIGWLSAHAQLADANSDMRFKAITSRQGLSSIFCMTQDENGFIWMGTRDGLNRYDGYDFVTYKYDPSNINSISNNEITCLYADPKGLLWIGTRGGGLNLLDRRTNHIDRFPDIVGANIVRNIFRSANGTLWVGTPNGLVKVVADVRSQTCHFENISLKAHYKAVSGRTIRPNKPRISVVSVNELSPDTLLVGSEYGLFLYFVAANEFRSVDMGADFVSIITSILVDARGNIWLGAFEALLKLTPATDGKFTITPYSNRQAGARYIRTNRIESVVADRAGNVWAGSRGGGLVKVSADGRASTYMHDAMDYQSINDNIVNALLVDKTGVLWIGSESHGCCMSDLYRKKFSNIRYFPNRPNSLGSSLVTAITGDGNGRLWVGSAEGGLDKLNFSKGSYSIGHFPNINLTGNTSSSEVVSLLEDRDHTLWVGTASNSICQFVDDHQYKCYPSNGYVFSIYQDRAGHIWYGTWGQGLGLIDKQSGRIRTFTNDSDNPLSLRSDKVLTILEDDFGNLWVGTKGGGVSVAPIDDLLKGTNAFTTFTNQNATPGCLSHNDIYCIARDSHGDVWIGTGAGLNKVLPARALSLKDAIRKGAVTFQSYQEKDGLPNNVIYSILEDKHGSLWLSTNNGLCVFNPRSGRTKNYFDNDGLQANEFHSNAFFKDKEGCMYIGGVNGLTIFNPDSIKDNPFAAQTRITGLKIFNQPIMPGDKVNGRVLLHTDIVNTSNITLSYKNKELTFEFSAMHFANPQKIRYAYRLQGFNDKWQETKDNNRSVTYTNLDQGTYTLQVKATNNDGVWSAKPASLVITVLPPFWLSGWFSIVYVFLVLGGLYLFRKYSLIAVKEKNRLLIERLEHKKQVEITNAKMRFFTNISHEIRTPLTLIYDPLERAMAEGQMDAGSQKLLGLMSKNVNRLLLLVNQLLQFQKIDMGFVSLKVSEISLLPFIQDVSANFSQKIGLKNIALTIDSYSDKVSVWVDGEFMTTVFYNLLSNAIKFTPDGGEITIKVYPFRGDFEVGFITGLKSRLFSSKKEKDWIAIEITDSGKGIPERELSRIFNRFYQINDPAQYHHAGSGIGLALVKEYVDLHKGQIDVVSMKDSGSRFTVYLPVGKAHFRADQIVSKSKTRPTEEPMRLSDDDATDDEQEVELVVHEGETTLLIIEDDHELAYYLRDYFVQSYKVVVSFDGKMGYDKAVALSPDLVISDVMLPGLNGFEICSKLKTNIETSHIPIILLTAKAAEEDIIVGYEGGADSYMAKPFNIKILAAQVKGLMETRDRLRSSFSKQVYLKPADLAITSLDEQFLQRLMDVANKHLSDNEFDVGELVGAMNMSHTVILKKIKALTGLSLVDFIKSLRLKQAAQILQKEKYPIAEVGYMVGFSDAKYFSKCFVKEFGKTPTEYSNEFHRVDAD